MSNEPIRIFSALQFMATEAPLPLRIVGASMTPVMEAGQRVEVQPCSIYLPGDVLAFRSADDTLVIHRLLGYRLGLARCRLVLRGDAARRCDAPVPVSRVLGKVISLDGVPWRPTWHFRRVAGRRYIRYVLDTLVERMRRVAGA